MKKPGLPVSKNSLSGDVLERIFFCDSCLTWRLPKRPFRPIHLQFARRTASTLSSTAVNATKPVPARLKPLHEALANVGKRAAPYVNLSRLQLALQSLESERATIRIAFLGVDAQDTARQLVRLLLADPLENESTWEKQISQQGGNQGFLIRYGQLQNSNIPQRTTVPIIQVPAPFLQKLNVEILVSSLHGSVRNGTAVPIEAFLAPAVGTPTDASGRQVTINQPVHQSYIIVDGLHELVSASRLLSSATFQDKEDVNLINLIVNIKNNATASANPIVIDVSKADEGIQAIRKSISGASTFGQKWAESGVSAVLESLDSKFGNTQLPSQASVSPSVRFLISSLLTSANANIAKARKSSVATNERRSLNMAAKHNLDSVLDDFSRSAHQELQAGLESAWSSRNWRKLAWYKLFWRVDDVGLIVTDLVTSAWLPKTERAVYELSGRLIQVGITPIMAETQVSEPDTYPTVETVDAPALQSSTVLATATNEAIPSQPVIRNDSGVPTIKIEPLPRPTPIASAISNARGSYIYDSTTSLTSTAQQLVLRTFSISGLSAGLSGLVYASALSATMYEAGTIFAVGTVFAMWRLQSGWQTATKNIEQGLFEEGRNVISKVVNRMRLLVESAAQTPIDPVEQAAIEEAQSVVNKAELELVQLDAKQSSSTANQGGEKA